MSFFSVKVEPPPEQNLSGLEERRVASDQADISLPTFWGWRRLADRYITPFFDKKSEDVREEVGSGKGSAEVDKGKKRYASYGAKVARGPANYLFAIHSNDEEIWRDNSPAELVGNGPVNITLLERENSTVRFYRGTADQPADSYAASKLGTQPSHPYAINVVYQQLFLGLSTGQSLGPVNMEYEMARIPRRLILDPSNATGDAANDALSYHHDNYSVLLPEVIFDCYTDPMLADPLPVEYIDTDSFISACNDFASDGFYLSPYLERPARLREFVLDLLSHHYCQVYRRGGELKFRIFKSSDVAISVPALDWLDEPNLKQAANSKVKTDIKVSYSARDRRGDAMPAQAFSPAALAIAKCRRPERVERKFIDREDVASQVASILSVIKGTPERTLKGSLMSKAAYLQLKPGDVIAPIYPRKRLDGSERFRISKINRRGGDRSGVAIEAERDFASAIENASGTSTGFSYTEPPLDPDDCPFHIAMLTGLQRQNYADGVVAAVARPDVQTDGAILSFSPDNLEYQSLALVGMFALRLQILQWKDIGSGFITADIRFTNEHDHNEFSAMLASALTPLWYLLTATVIEGTEYNDPVWSTLRFDAPIESLGDQDWRVRFESGAIGSDPYSSTGVQPTIVGYLGPQKAFIFHRDNQLRIERSGGNGAADVNQVRYFRVQSRLERRTQDISDAPLVSYDRINDTMSTNWGGAATHVTELGDPVTIPEDDPEDLVNVQPPALPNPNPYDPAGAIVIADRAELELKAAYS